MMNHLLFLIFFLGLFSCSKKSTINREAIVSSADSAKTYLALGDSYTIGQSVALNERFPAQTVALLRQEGIKLSDPHYIAQTGWTTASLQQAISFQNPASHFDVVSLLIGVNDQYQRVDTGNYALRFTQLLEKAIQLAKGKRSNVFVLSIPDYSVTPYVASADKPTVKKEINWFNAINKRITLNFGVSYTDITPSSQEAESNATLLAADNLHPSGLAYKKWAEMLAPKMKAVLK